MSSSQYLIGIDVGGTKITIGLYNATCELQQNYRIDSGNRSDADIEIEIRNAISELTKIQSSIVSVGISSAGPIDLQRIEISPVNIPSFRKFPLGAIILDQLAKNGSKPKIAIQGDIIGMARAEISLDSALQTSSAFLVNAGTGIGGALISNGKVLTGDTGNSGYFGHASVAFDGPTCKCGANGCVEFYAGGAAMLSRAIENGVTQPITDFAELNSLAESGDQAARRTIEIGASAIAQATVNVMLINDLSKIICTGGVALSSEIFYQKFISDLALRVKPHAFLANLTVRKALLNSSSAELGAALLAREVVFSS